MLMVSSAHPPGINGLAAVNLRTAANFINVVESVISIAALSTIIGGIGLSLALGGVAQLISPTPNFSAMERGKEAARLESFTFSGVTNTVQQGLPVPIVYGRAYIGSAVISSGLDVDQLV